MDLKRYFYHNIIAIDQLFNAITGGAADETLSSRTYRGAILTEQPKKRWRVLYRFINWLLEIKIIVKKPIKVKLQASNMMRVLKPQDR